MTGQQRAPIALEAPPAETPQAARPRGRRRWILLGVLAALLALFVLYCVHENLTLELSRYTLSSPKLTQEVKIVHLSDLHKSEFGEGNARLLEMVRGESPDLIVFTGDLIDRRATDASVAESLMRDLTAIAPVCYVQGNHEAHSALYPALRQAMLDAGVHVLENECVELTLNGQAFTIGGTEEMNSYIETIQEYLAALSDAPAENYHLLLAHFPDRLTGNSQSKYRYCDYDIDLVLSGHMHGGQIRIPFTNQGLFSPSTGFFPQYTGGLYEANGVQMVLSRGLGNSIFPIRINDRPEVVSITLTPES